MFLASIARKLEGSMIVSCPDCGAQYRVDDAVFGAGGRLVRCSKCACEWYQIGSAQAKERDAPPKIIRSDSPPSQPQKSRQSAPRFGDRPEPAGFDGALHYSAADSRSRAVSEAAAMRFAERAGEQKNGNPAGGQMAERAAGQAGERAAGRMAGQMAGQMAENVIDASARPPSRADKRRSVVNKLRRHVKREARVISSTAGATSPAPSAPQHIWMGGAGAHAENVPFRFSEEWTPDAVRSPDDDAPNHDAPDVRLTAQSEGSAAAGGDRGFEAPTVLPPDEARPFYRDLAESKRKKTARKAAPRSSIDRASPQAKTQDIEKTQDRKKTQDVGSPKKNSRRSVAQTAKFEKPNVEDGDDLYGQDDRGGGADHDLRRPVRKASRENDAGVQTEPDKARDSTDALGWGYRRFQRRADQASPGSKIFAGAGVLALAAIIAYHASPIIAPSMPGADILAAYRGGVDAVLSAPSITGVRAGLVFVDSKYDLVERTDGKALEVWGVVANNGPGSTLTPTIEIVSRSEDGKALQRWVARPELQSLQPGEKSRFTARMMNPLGPVFDVDLYIASR